MRLHKLKPAEGSRRSRRCVGRGISSGHGKTSGRRQEGQLARQDRRTRSDFEGGQMPSFRTTPKCSSKNTDRKEYAVVNLDDLNKFENGNEVTIADLRAKGLVRRELSGVESLVNGELEIKVTVKVNKASKAAEEAVNAAGGSVEVI